MDKIKIFIVDDSIGARAILKKALSNDKSFEVVGESSSGVELVSMLDNLDANVLILETNISGEMKLDEIIKNVRSQDDNIKIILCSDCTAKDKIIPATKIGADDFVIKPYNIVNIKRVIHESVGR